MREGSGLKVSSNSYRLRHSGDAIIQKREANMTHLTRALRVALAIVLLAAPAGAQTGTVRIIQTNAAGDNVHITDPATQEVVDVILGIPMAHGVTSAPDGSALYFSNEVDHTLDIVPTKTLRVTKQIPLTVRRTTSPLHRTAARCTLRSREKTPSSTSFTSTRKKS